MSVSRRNAIVATAILAVGIGGTLLGLATASNAAQPAVAAAECAEVIGGRLDAAAEGDYSELVPSPSSEALAAQCERSGFEATASSFGVGNYREECFSYADPAEFEDEIGVPAYSRVVDAAPVTGGFMVTVCAA